MASGERARPARGQSRAALVAAAVDLFSHRPYDEIYISDIAEQAGVAHGLLFYHFKDKRGLYLAGLKQVLDELAELHAPRDGEDTREGRLRGVLHRQIAYRRDHVHTTLAMIRAAGQDPEVDALFEEARRVGSEFLLDLLDIRGTSSVQLRIAVRGCMGLVDEMTLDWLTHDRDLEMADLEQLAYAGIVAVLSTVCVSHADIREVVTELSAAT
ncbi:TetR/AcrR family transcriptional regulator [Saccharopolyspora pogona]|uniref:TetR/AcrR family transcriptional regulator n=1 Tax=Saccharopolyspora pogona TaxID=333966 RepID=UPI001683EAFD|nr:TetR/AcrR family transcriptional regulator [Saccharopolyspora pogona]